MLDACPLRPAVRLELYYRERVPARLVVRHAGEEGAREGAVAAKEYTAMHTTESADAAAGEVEPVFWEVVGKRLGEVWNEMVEWSSLPDLEGNPRGWMIFRRSCVVYTRNRNQGSV